MGSNPLNLGIRFLLEITALVAIGYWGFSQHTGILRFLLGIGLPVILAAMLDCTILSQHSAGTHTIYVGKVQTSYVPRPDEPPLVYWNRGYRQLELWDTD